MCANPFKSAGGKKPTTSGTENIPPALVVDPFTIQLKVPSSPTKRLASTSHYTGGDYSPSKKRDLGRSKPTAAKALPDERGLLFADATNSCAMDIENGTSDVPIIGRKVAGTGRPKRGSSRKRTKVEVVIPSIVQRELEVDVFN